jgi:GTP-binding protein YchF
MKSGIIGGPGSGKTTVFEALTGNFQEAGRRGDDRIAAIRVPDPRVDVLAGMYSPRKTTYAQVEYLLPGKGLEKDSGKTGSSWTAVRDCDALIHVVRNFSSYGLAEPTPLEDVNHIDQELILNDFMVAEKRLERLNLDQKRGRKSDSEERALLEACISTVENNTPLRRRPELASEPLLRGFAFLSSKPMLVLFNNADEDDGLPDITGGGSNELRLAIRGKLEHELAQMSPEEAAEFLKEFDIATSAKDRIIAKSYELLGLISFFTVGEDEVKAWTIRKHTAAIDAAEAIHTDLKKGFIRAEVLAYDDLMTAGSYAAARKSGTVRLEGKDYEVQDGDILHVRFNV